MSKERLLELIRDLDISEVMSFDLKYKNFDAVGEDERKIYFEKLGD